MRVVGCFGAQHQFSERGHFDMPVDRAVIVERHPPAFAISFAK